MHLSTFTRGLLTAVCMAASSLTVAQLAAQDAPVTAAVPVDVQETLIDEIDFEGVRLTDAIDYFKEVCPGFQAVVISSPNNLATNPVLPSISLKNIKLRNALRLLGMTVPGLTFDTIENGDGDGRILLFRVDVAEGAPDNVLRIFPLRSILGRTDDRVKALDDTLSLL